MAFGGRVITAVITWLSHRSFWQLVSMGLLLLLIVVKLQLVAEQRHANKLQTQLSKVEAQLKAISSKRDEQKAETKERIKVVTRTIKEADGRAKVVEQAPLPGNCKTPDAVLRADL